jgi:NAD(P)-dependent dehydrogenase (short-subunit alcohol dehydrogenase family)
MKTVITGAASGIGRAVAERFAADAAGRDERCELLLVDIAADALAEVAETLNDAGASAAFTVADLADPDVGDVVAAAVAEHLGGVDALVSNAGVCLPGDFADLAIEDFDRTFAINTRATWLLGKALLPWLTESRGSIVATASISGREPTPPFGAYSASKAALMMLISQMALEWGPLGIRCNTVSPGSVHTGMTDALYTQPGKKDDRAARVPIREVGSPEQIAATIAFLAGPDAGYVTGVDLLVDGGLRTLLMPTIREL